MINQLFRKKSVKQILEENKEGSTNGLMKVLGVRDLIFIGIAAVVGAGIFTTIGKASYDGGPGIILLFAFVAVACGFAAFCYAEFASMVPISGSAYTYSYVAFGELIAWIIGWDLLMEYAIGNIVVAISWSEYFTTMLDNGFTIGSTHLHYHVPDYLTMDYWTAQEGQSEAAIAAWNTAPMIGNMRVICDLPAFFITAILTWIIYVGIKESKKATNFMVIFKLVIIFFVVVLGAAYVSPENYNPFLPNGLAGILKGTAAVFFAYIGFDAISTTAEECKNPQRDLPKAMIWSLVICTIIYILVALVLTGMVSYTNLDREDPLAYVFSEVGKSTGTEWLNSMAGIVAVSAVVATASVMLVFQLGQPRIWMSMSRDGLLPPVFARIHPKFKTPSFSTILTGLIVGIPSLFLNMNVVLDLSSVGTLFAFVLVCGGILRLQFDKNRPESKFKTPFFSGRIWMPVITAVLLFFLIKYEGSFLSDLFNFKDAKNEFSWQVMREKVPLLFFAFFFLVIFILSIVKNFSLIPTLGLLSCTYLMCVSGVSNWERFLVWLAVGLAIYFLYGKRKSKLANV